MSRLNIAPTRRNFLETRRRLAGTIEGHDLLEEKRQILIMELMAQVEVARRIKEEVTRTMALAHNALRKAAVRAGLTGLMRQNCGITMRHSLTFRHRAVMGVPVPQVKCQPENLSLQFGLTDGRSQTDEVMRTFVQVLGLIAQLAEVENAVLRLAREIKRTQRRVNALEKIYIPEYRETLSFIAGVLEERQREEFVVLRKVKRKRQRILQQNLPTGRAARPDDASTQAP